MKLWTLVGPSNVDQTASVEWGSVTVKLNTLDFSFMGPVSGATLGGSVVVTQDGFSDASTPATGNGWQGTIKALTSDDLVDRGGTTVRYTVTAENSQAALNGGSVFDLTDVAPTSTLDEWLLEDGSGAWLLEDNGLMAGGSWLLESSAVTINYRRLSVRNQTNIDATTSTFGSLEIFTPGLWPGMTFKLTSASQGYSAALQTVSQVTLRYLTQTTPVFTIEFGTTQLTMNQRLL